MPRKKRLKASKPKPVAQDASESPPKGQVCDQEGKVVSDSQSPPEPPGAGEPLAGSDLFQDPDHVRADARMVAKMLSLGVVPTERAEVLVRQAFIMLAESAQDKNARRYISLMKVILEAAKLGQVERHKLLDKAVPDQHAITVQQGAMVRAALEEIQGDERFEQLARDGAARDYASSLGSEGKQGILVGGTASQTDRQGSNGSAASSNGTANSDH